MEKLLMSCVGNQDPFSFREIGKSYDEVVGIGIEQFKERKAGPIISFCKQLGLNSEDSAILLYTRLAKNVRTPTEKGAIDTKEVLHRDFGISEKNIRLVTFNSASDPDFNPSDPAMVIDRMRQSLQDAITDEDEKFETFVISSSGTPQMQKAWFLLVNSGFIKARLFQANGDEIKLEPLFEDQLLTEACNLIRTGNFSSVTEILYRLSKTAVSENRRDVFNILSIAAEGYRLWTSFEYKQASEKFAYVVEELSKFLMHLSPAERSRLKNLSDTLADHQRFLTGILNSLELRLLDIYQSAERHYLQKNYLEAIWRLDVICDFALIETALRVIEGEYGIQFKSENFYVDLEVSSLSKLKYLVELIMPKNSSFNDLRESQARRLLHEIKPDILRKVASINRDSLAGTRNSAVHYAKPIYREKVDAGLETAKNFVETLLNKQILTNQYHPLSQDNLQNIANIFQEIGVGRF